MKIMEFETLPGMSNVPLDGMPSGMYDASSDTVSTANMMDTRKNKLTLRDLNKLKKLRAFRRLETLKRQDSLSIIYGETDDDGGGGGMM